MSGTPAGPMTVGDLTEELNRYPRSMPMRVEVWSPNAGGFMIAAATDLRVVLTPGQDREDPPIAGGLAIEGYQDPHPVGVVHHDPTDGRRTRVTQSVGDYPNWVAQYYDPSMEVWFDIGDSKPTREEAAAVLPAEGDPTETRDDGEG